MATLLAERSTGIEVMHFYGFADVEVAKDPLPGQLGVWDISGPRRGEKVTSGPNALIVAVDPEPQNFVRYERWDAEPPPYDEEEMWRGALFLASGRICAVGDAEGERYYSSAFDLGREMTEWQARLWLKLLDNDRDARFPRDLYLMNLLTLQLWLGPGLGDPSPGRD